MEKLAPCPFCGGEAKTRHIRDGREVFCRGCLASGPPEYFGRADQLSAEARAIDAWNGRASAGMLGPYKDAELALDATRRACAELIGADPDTWPSHGNAPLAIASALALARSSTSLVPGRSD